MQLFVYSSLQSSPNLLLQFIPCHSHLYLNLVTCLEHFMPFCAFIHQLKLCALFGKLFSTLLHLKTSHLLEPSSEVLSTLTSLSGRSVGSCTVFPVYSSHIYCLVSGLFECCPLSRLNSQRAVLAFGHLCILNV